MKQIVLILLTGSLFAGCSASSAHVAQVHTGGTPVSVANSSANSNTDYERGSRNYEDLMKQRQSRRADENSAAKTVQAEFENVDFDNFDFPEIGESFTIRLRNGKYDFENKRHCNFREYESDSVDFYDLNGDGKPEALVTLSDHAGCGSSGMFELYYLYSMVNGKPRLLWSFETGYQSQCGYQAESIKDSKLTIDVIGNCDYENKRLFNQDSAADIEAYHLTRFTFGWKGRKFQQLSREVIELP